MITKDQLKRFKREVKAHLDDEITEVKLSHCISYYNSAQKSHSIYITGNLLEVTSPMGNGMQMRYSPDTKIDAMLTAMAFVMVNSHSGNTMHFNMGGFKF